jgi:hypothetical protein
MTTRPHNRRWRRTQAYYRRTGQWWKVQDAWSPWRTPPGVTSPAQLAYSGPIIDAATLAAMAASVGIPKRLFGEPRL